MLIPINDFSRKYVPRGALLGGGGWSNYWYTGTMTMLLNLEHKCKHKQLVLLQDSSYADSDDFQCYIAGDRLAPFE